MGGVTPSTMPRCNLPSSGLSDFSISRSLPSLRDTEPGPARSVYRSDSRAKINETFFVLRLDPGFIATSKYYFLESSRATIRFNTPPTIGIAVRHFIFSDY